MELTNEFTVGVPVDRAWALLTDVERIAPCMPGAQLQEIDGDEYRGIVKVKVGPITAQYKGAATFVEKDDDGHRAVLRAEGRETRGQGNASATITATLVPDGGGTHVTVLTDLTVTGRVAQFGRGVLADVSAKLLGQFVSCLETTVLGDGDGTPAAEAGAPEAAVVAPPATAAAAEPASPAGDQPAADATAAPAESASPAGDQPGSDATAAAPEPAAAATDTAPAGAGDPAPVAATEPAPLAASDTGPGAAGPPAAGTAAAPARPAASSNGARRIDHPEAEPVDLLGVAGAPVGRRVAPLLAVLAAILVVLRLRRRRR